MPRASWKGFLRLSLVSCPIYLSPATTRTKSIRLHQVWQATPADETDELPDRARAPDGPKSAARFSLDDGDDEAGHPREAARIALRPHDPNTGEEVKKEEVVKRYEYQRGQFVTFSAEGLKALDVESSKSRLALYQIGDNCAVRDIWFSGVPADLTGMRCSGEVAGAAY